MSLGAGFVVGAVLQIPAVIVTKAPGILVAQVASLLIGLACIVIAWRRGL